MATSPSQVASRMSLIPCLMKGALWALSIMKENIFPLALMGRLWEAGGAMVGLGKPWDQLLCTGAGRMPGRKGICVGKGDWFGCCVAQERLKKVTRKSYNGQAHPTLRLQLPSLVLRQRLSAITGWLLQGIANGPAAYVPHNSRL
ncbi:hypothetical protein MC885_001376, partial [Smutsia gigantea]